MKQLYLAWPKAGTVHYGGRPGMQYFNGVMHPVLEIHGVPEYVTEADLEDFIIRLASRPAGLRIPSDDTPSRNGARTTYSELIKAALDTAVALPESDKPARLRQLERDEYRYSMGLAGDAERAQADARLNHTLPKPKAAFATVADRLAAYREARALLG